MPDIGNEAELIADAQGALGDHETVVSAGVFGLQDLVAPQIAGQMAGGYAGSTLAGVGGGVAGVLFGGLVARKASAEARGMTLKLIVAVTASRIHILNWDDRVADRRGVASFDRTTTTVKVKHFGLSRVVTIKDSSSGARMTLHASASRAMAQSGPDKDVLAELTRTG